MADDRFTFAQALKEPMSIVALGFCALVLAICIYLYAAHMA